MGHKVEKIWEVNGLTCVVLATNMGHRCGYVGVPNTHPLYEKNYNGLDLRVHGGLTYSDSNLKNYPIEKSNQMLWFFGFDCAHTGDARDFELMSEEYKKVYSNQIFRSIDGYGTVKTLEYCIIECESLALQLVHLE